MELQEPKKSTTHVPLTVIDSYLDEHEENLLYDYAAQLAEGPTKVEIQANGRTVYANLIPLKDIRWTGLRDTFKANLLQAPDEFTHRNIYRSPDGEAVLYNHHLSQFAVLYATQKSANVEPIVQSLTAYKDDYGHPSKLSIANVDEKVKEYVN